MHEHEQDAQGRQICTTSGEAPGKVRSEQTEETGQHKSYIVLCEEERQKGFVRPYRDAYRHAGRLSVVCAKPHPDAARAADGWVCSMPPHDGECVGFGRKVDMTGCGVVTTMGRALSETYARDPRFYGATFCVRCNRHLPVNEFTWTTDGAAVGS